MANICPTCEKDDKIKIVSTIVQSGISHSTGKIPVEYSYIDSDGKKHSRINYEKFSATQISSLAKTLLPPPMPKSPSGLMFVLGLIRTSVAIIIFLLIGTSSLTGSNKSAPLFMISVIVLVFFIPHLFYEIISHGKAKKIFEIDMPMWEKSIDRWERLYYCERDGVIYVPGDKPAHISKINEYLYWHPYKLSLWEKLLLRWS